MTRYFYTITGIVQGVGFRPFIYKLAQEYALGGFVFNDSNGVTIEIEGKKELLAKFETQLKETLPPLAKINTIEKKEITPVFSDQFIIKETHTDTNKTTLVSPDIKVCDDCLEDIKKEGKFYNYFATNCTNCGPRYSIIQTVPYDRVNTSMNKFEMCASCKENYENPINRRYHAQPISCNSCGPKMSLSSRDNLITNKQDEIYIRLAQIIKGGKIVAIKGIGGFHIVCDASNEDVIKKLRSYKNRPTKPFAIMCKNITQIQKIVKTNNKEKELLLSKEAPIVVCEKKESLEQKYIASNIAPEINRVGCFLAYTPLHHILFEYLEKPIVATSANLNGEPIITTQEKIIEKLPFCEYILDFDREIINAVDDSVLQVLDKHTLFLRAGRGYTPKVIKLKKKINQKILAVGANAKNSIAIAFDDTLIISPYIGDLDSIISFDYFKRTIETFKNFYDFEPDVIVHDKHPNYETTKWAKSYSANNTCTKKVQLLEVQHHLAHIYATKAEYFLEKKEYLGFSFDGTGYGDDGTLWGGEVFVNDTRRYHFRPIKLLGGAKAIKEPRRVALAMLFDRYSLDEVLSLQCATVKAFSKGEIQLLHNSYIKNLNSPKTSSVGRLFDAIASLANLIQLQSYEGEAGLYCENIYNEDITESFSFEIDNGIIDIEYALFQEKQELVSKFMNTLVEIIVAIALKEKKKVILSGGVFQNKTLLGLVIKKLQKKKIAYYFQRETSINDGGISLGQIYFAIKNKLV